MSREYQNKVSIAILKLNFLAKNLYWQKEDHYIMLKGTVNLGSIILACTSWYILNIYEAKADKITKRNW